MNTIIKKGKLNGIIDAIPSKSYLHRYLIASILTNKKCVLKVNTKYLSNDIYASLSCIKALGVDYEIKEDEIILNPLIKKEDIPVLDVLESGSSLRFFIPLSLCIYDKVIFKLSKRLMERGIDGYNDLFTSNDIKVEYQDNEISLQGKIQPNDYIIDASKSSQYVSGMLIALAYINKNNCLKVDNVASKPYSDITVDVLNNLGYEIKAGNNQYLIKSYNNVNNIFNIEGDYSNSAFLDAFNYFGSNIQIKGLNLASNQGDKVYLDYFKELNKKKCRIDIKNCIDLGPVLFVFASLKNGGIFTSCSRLKIKESNRLNDMIEEMKKYGLKYQLSEDEDTLEIDKVDIDKYQNLTFDSHNDHRLVMALSLVLSITGGKIINSDAVKKSYPNFFDDLKLLGLELEVE
ncbi:MAG: hypothetical protein K6E74_04870 [Bacilli bacterium]|nr:hypothetical protein [Bacilli bacterium]